jgi:hypothetical protein
MYSKINFLFTNCCLPCSFSTVPGRRRDTGGARIHAFLTSVYWKEASDELYPWVETPGTHWVGGLGAPRKHFERCGDDFPVVHPAA